MTQLFDPNESSKLHVGQANYHPGMKKDPRPNQISTLLKGCGVLYQAKVDLHGSSVITAPQPKEIVTPTKLYQPYWAWFLFCRLQEGHHENKTVLRQALACPCETFPGGRVRRVCPPTSPQKKCILDKTRAVIGFTAWRRVAKSLQQFTGNSLLPPLDPKISSASPP